MPQYDTGTCWAFCSTSFFESEAARLGGPRVKLSEMWTVYWEYVEKARRFVRERGHSPVAEGSQDHGTQEVYRLYGAVPREAYRGVLDPDGWYDHPPLRDEIAGYLRSRAGERRLGRGDGGRLGAADPRPPPGAAAGDVRLRGADLDAHRVPGRRAAPPDLDDYVNCVSTLRYPFHTRVLLDVADNWRRRDDYLNLPLDEFYRVIRETVQAGGTISIGGDVSEPGMDGLEGAAVIPAWDIPAKLIGQDSRELRLVNGTTGDDHGVHLVGFLRHGGRDWFLVKDSNQSSRLGRFKGYYFYDGDYIRLKMLSFMVHKDRLQGGLPPQP